MKAKLTDWLNSLSGSMGKDFYAVPCPKEPGYCIIRRKPGPRNPNGKCKKSVLRGAFLSIYIRLYQLAF